MTATSRTITLREAAPEDDWAVHRLFYALHEFNASLDPRFELADGWAEVLDEHLAHVRAEGHGLTLLAWDGDEPVGLVMMDVHTDSRLFKHRRWAELVALYVDPRARGGTVARQLLDAAVKWARENGHERIQLYVTASNERARRFYARAGFRPTQEIWRLELGQSDHAFAADPACEHVPARHHDLLTLAHHRFSLEDDEGED